jgi:hypothetical protein
MLIPTKYNVGYTFWVPRCHKKYTKEKIVIDGIEWKRDVEELVAYAKQKKIIKIAISVDKDNKPYIQYYTINTDENEKNSMSQVHAEDTINEYSYDDAEELAEAYQAKGEEYFGM